MEDQKNIEKAVSVLIKGGIVAIPTDTIYGICCLVSNDVGIQKIYNVKQRKDSKPLAICVENFDQLYQYSKCWMPINHLSKLLPGKSTLIFKRSACLNSLLNPLTELIGIRITSSPPVQQMVKLCGEPLALTSANLSGEPNPSTSEDFKKLWPMLDYIFPIEPSNYFHYLNFIPLASTVIDLSLEKHFKIIRRGCNAEEYERILAKDLQYIKLT